MPSAVTAVIFAAETRLDEDLVASVVALSICAGVTILPFLPGLVRFLMSWWPGRLPRASPVMRSSATGSSGTRYDGRQRIRENSEEAQEVKAGIQHPVEKFTRVLAMEKAERLEMDDDTPSRRGGIIRCRELLKALRRRETSQGTVTASCPTVAIARVVFATFVGCKHQPPERATATFCGW